ncbi:hypothetical protein BURCENBC7_AP3705 [Burkholderia cenocepacia BC7]|nr:hypothetical protein BURCENK562V_C2600 [Burkholderia cenocepacia K56-2Valvano]ERI31159.1 hypothetical protein BURCENBC7_AP3705 [Burkholderia cenocepacia BC7]
MRACNHPVQDDPTKFCAYRYRMRREASDARERSAVRRASGEVRACIASH